MDEKLIEERVRQVMALDQNAFDIYTDLAKFAPTGKMKETLLALAIDESRHVQSEKAILKLILP